MTVTGIAVAAAMLPARVLHSGRAIYGIVWLLASSARAVEQREEYTDDHIRPNKSIHVFLTVSTKAPESAANHYGDGCNHYKKWPQGLL